MQCDSLNWIENFMNYIAQSLSTLLLKVKIKYIVIIVKKYQILYYNG